MPRKVLIIQAHPLAESFCHAIADAAAQAASSVGADVKVLELADLSFELNLKRGYKTLPPLEQDLVRAQELLMWCDHIVLTYPNWWGTMPALLKGFFDRVFLPGFAFKYKQDGGLMPEGLLKGRRAMVFITMDTPPWYYRWFMGAPGSRAIRQAIFGHCGIRPTKVYMFGPMRRANDERRKLWLAKVSRLILKVAA